MEALDETVRRIFPDLPSHLPAPELADRQRSILLSHISESTNQRRGGGYRTIFKKRVPLGIALGLALSGLGGGIGWAISNSSAPSASPPATPSITFTVCAATTPSGSSANYVIVGSDCGPGHLPQVGFTPESPPHTYCVVSGEAPIPQNMIFVTDSTSCPNGYETTSPPPDTTPSIPQGPRG
jgi:hypothetical protein